MKSLAALLLAAALTVAAGLSLAAIASPPDLASSAAKDGVRAAEVWVDDDYTSGGWNDGHTWGTDAFNTIQAGIAAVEATGTVHVAAGTFTENIQVNKALSLFSLSGRSATTIQGNMAGAELGAIQVSPGVNGLHIGDTGRGFTIIGIDGPPGVEKAGIYFQGAHADVTVRDNEIRANGDEGLLTEYNASISNFTIDGNTFSGQTFLGTTPGGLGFADQFTVPNVPRQLVVMGGGAGGTNGSSVSFTNNLITGIAGGLNGDGLEQGNSLVTIDTDNSTFTGNIFSGVTTRYGVSLRCRRPGAGISGNSFICSSLGSLCGHLTLTNNAITDALAAANGFDRACYIESPAGGTIGFTVSAAVAAAPAASVLKLLPGVYQENVQIATARDISIVGAGADQTILETTKNTTLGGNVPSEAWIYNGNGISLTMKNLTLDGSGALIHHAVQSRGALTVEDCVLRNIRYGQYYGRGIVLFAGTSNAIRRTTLSNIERIGIHVRGAVDTPLPEAVIEQITYLGKGAGDWLDYGVEFGGGGRGSVSSSVLCNCVGLALTDSSQSAGILATDFFGPGTQATVLGSVFDHCSNGISVGYEPTDLTTVTATGNSFATCASGVSARNFTALYASAHGNWWGDPTGPKDLSDDRATGGLYNPGGLGVPVTDGVDYDPWILGDFACAPDPQNITQEDGPAGGPFEDAVTVRYLGGLSGPLHAFDLAISVDTTFAKIVAVAGPATGPFANAAVFTVTSGTGGSRQVHAELDGAVPGALLPCALFTVTFRAIRNTLPEGTPIPLTLLDLRDGSNNTLTGGAADPGLLSVDVSILAAVQDGIGAGAGLDRLSVVPNPLPGRGELRFALSAPSSVTMEIFDTSGRLRTRSFFARMPAGPHVLELEARDAAGRPLPAGAYLCRLQAGAERAIRRVIVVR